MLPSIDGADEGWGRFAYGFWEMIDSGLSGVM